MQIAVWDAVTTKTVVNRFWKSKKLSEIQKVPIDDPFNKLEEDVENLHSVQPDLVSENMDTASFTDADAEALVVQSPPSDPEIVENGRCK